MSTAVAADPIGEEFCDVGRGVELCYEAFGDPADPPALLIMGLGMQMIGWHPDFCRELASRGFHVIRFDNRDAGLSTAFSFPTPSFGALLRRRFHPQQYTLEDMAQDSANLLARLELAPAHVVGASMGGMIGQALAARHPRTVRSLTSIMSTTGSRVRGQASPMIYRALLTPTPRGREAYLEHAVALFGTIGSPGMLDPESTRRRAMLAYERRHDPGATLRQLGAIAASGNRTRDLRGIRAPTLVLHGTKDRLVSISGGRATARAIPGARFEALEGMGHDLPRAFDGRIADAIAANAARELTPTNPARRP